MADITFPATVRPPRSVEFGLRSNTMAFASPLTGAVRTVGLPGARWVASLQWAALDRQQADELTALLVRLRGMENRLMLWNLAKRTLRGAGGGTPIVNGAGQTGASISVAGLPNNTTVYKAGDMLGIGGELKMATADATSNGSGVATVTFEPPLRASPSNGSAIVTSQPTARFVLNDSTVRWMHEPGGVTTGVAVELTEVFA